MRTETLNFGDGRVEVEVTDDEGRPVVRLEVALATSGARGDRYDVTTSTRVRSLPSETVMSVASRMAVVSR